MAKSNPEDVLGDLSQLMERITTRQGDISLLRQYIEMASDSGLDEEATAVRELAQMVVSSSDTTVWLPLLASKSKELGDTLDGVQEINAMYKRAAQDYLSIPLLTSHMDFVLEHQEMIALMDEDASETEAVRAVLSTIAQQASGHLTEGHLIWDRWRDWEVQQLDNAQPDEREALVERIDQMYIQRLQIPHSTQDETASSYSTFISTYKQDANYEQIMKGVTQARSNAKQAWEAREMNEIALRNASFSLDAFATYIAEEQKRQPRPEQPLRKGRKPPPRNIQAETLSRSLFVSLHERAIAAAAQRVWSGNDLTAETHLRAFWQSYLTALRADKDVAPQKELAVLYRATRSVPACGEVWARYIRALERHADYDGPKEGVEEAFTRALELAVVKDGVDDIVPLIMARADFERRSIVAAAEGDDEADSEGLIVTLSGGLTSCGKVSRRHFVFVHKSDRSSVNPTGDPRLRLEKYLAAVYEQIPELEKAADIWEQAAKFYRTSTMAWSEYLRVLSKIDETKTRTGYRDVVGKNIDWPEMLWEQWRAFEHAHGSLEDVEDALARIDQLNKKLVEKRAREAAEYQTQYAAAAVPSTSVEDNMQVDVLEDPAQSATLGSRKRKAEDESEDVAGPSAADASKRVKFDDSTLKRDRENSEVVVSDLPADASEEAIRLLFKNCGELREIKLVPLTSGPIAVVEFMSRDSVPTALTRDKKRVDGREVSVHASWRSTLYVTNFAEQTDDAAVRDMFTAFGPLLDVRWPSKKFKTTRRFCYIQYTNPAHAEAALSLHGQQTAKGMKLTVLISDPQRRKERTDADANDREVYVAGLSRFIKRGDLQSLFQQFGPIKDIRLQLDERGHSKGFAFIEFEETRSANSALSANNFELKSRRIAVTMADSRARGKVKQDAPGLGKKNAVRERTVRVLGLPAATQEGLLQQALEKSIQGIKRVEVFEDKGEAVVEFESAADVGKLMLRGTPVVFMDQELTIVEEGAGKGRLGPSQKKSAGSSKAQAVEKSDSTSAPKAAFVPRVAARPRAGIGSKPRAAIAPVSAGSGVVAMDSESTTAPTVPASGKGQDDFRRMFGA
ncbi:hypothetical protein BKA62DRAFT_705553 [Auriculariales sp. MPI-PUGE-AT-0066]|nr:hypothetical protein BKA62DRAFT_705553 [Auriculariales sp. MPI-PUGE-AT-0066]